MSISIHGNLQNQFGNTIKPQAKTEEDKVFSLPYVTEAGVVEGSIKELPESILKKSEEIKKYMEYRGTSLFTIGEDGSFHIREGLTHYDYMRAQATIRIWQMSMNRGGKAGY